MKMLFCWNAENKVFDEGPPFTESGKVFGRIMEIKDKAEQKTVLLLFFKITVS